MLKVYDRVLDRRMQDIETHGNSELLTDRDWLQLAEGDLAEALEVIKGKIMDISLGEAIVGVMATLAGWYEQLEREGRA